MCKDVTIALVGKYTKLEDSYASVTKALQHAAVAAGFRLKIKVQSEESHLCFTFCVIFCLHFSIYWYASSDLQMYPTYSLQYIEAADLEDVTRGADPVSYHEAWQQLCKSE